MDKTNYIVSGYVRSGTSMLMQALQAGGMKIYYNKKTEAIKQRWATPDYKANPKGFFELSGAEVRADDFPAKYKGQAIKLLHDGLKRLPVGKYKIIYLLRDPKEIEQSIKKVWGKNMTLKKENYWKWMAKGQEYMKNRRDIEYVVYNYEEIISWPLKIFKELKEKGWPIDPESAASAIDPVMYRNRLSRGGIIGAIQRYLKTH